MILGLVNSLDKLPKASIYVGVKFNRFDDSKFEGECRIFGLLGTLLYHGWIIHPLLDKSMTLLKRVRTMCLFSRMIIFTPRSSGDMDGQSTSASEGGPLCHTSFLHSSNNIVVLHQHDILGFEFYLEVVSVVPQLKIVEPFKVHYLFDLSVARFLSCAHWVRQVLDNHDRLLTALGYGLWPSMVLISEIVQTFILADFCYYYVKRNKLYVDHGMHACYDRRSSK
ncbi:putative ER lumen protein-retaining receptor [Tanacetum coccineum]